MICHGVISPVTWGLMHKIFLCFTVFYDKSFLGSWFLCSFLRWFKFSYCMFSVFLSVVFLFPLPMWFCFLFVFVWLAPYFPLLFGSKGTKIKWTTFFRGRREMALKGCSIQLGTLTTSSPFLPRHRLNDLPCYHIIIYIPHSHLG